MRKRFNQLLPAYVNGTLGPISRMLVTLLLRIDARGRQELAQLERLQAVLGSATETGVREDVLFRILQQVSGEASAGAVSVKQQERRPAARRLAWMAVVLLAMLAAAVVWFTIPPTISLEWSVFDGQPIEFHVYRAHLDQSLDADEADFVLLDAIPADGSDQLYSYADLQILPGQRYLYRVDALDGSGAIVKSNTTLADSLGALPGQLVLLATLLLLVYVVISLVTGHLGTLRFSNGDQVSLL